MDTISLCAIIVIYPRVAIARAEKSPPNNPNNKRSAKAKIYAENKHVFVFKNKLFDKIEQFAYYRLCHICYAFRF